MSLDEEQKQIYRLSSLVSLQTTFGINSAFGLPAEEPVRIIHLYRSIQIEALQPSPFGWFVLYILYGAGETGEQGRLAAYTHVAQQARDQETGPSKGSLDVVLFLVIKLPGDQLAEDDVGVFGYSKYTVAHRRCTCGNKLYLSWVTIVHIRRPDASHEGLRTGRLEIRKRRFELHLRLSRWPEHVRLA